MTSRCHARRTFAVVLMLAAALVLSACGVTRGSDEGANRRLQMWIPNSPGGGYDFTGRAAAKVLEDSGLAGRFEITNVLGASGTVAMQRLVNARGDNDTVMAMGLGVVGAVYTNESDARVSTVTPIARLIEDQEALIVPKDSPFKTVDDLLAAWKKDPDSVAVGGGSSPGGPDHLFPMQLAKEVGIDPRDVKYIAYDGGGPLTTALLGKKIDVGTSGPSEFEGQIKDGSLRVLAVSGEERLANVDAPTLKESGVDMVFANWRGILAPPGISDKAPADLTTLFTKMHETQAWKDAVKRNGWIDSFATGDEFAAFLTAQDKRVETTLKELGLTDRHAGETHRRRRHPGRRHRPVLLGRLSGPWRHLCALRRNHPEQGFRRPGPCSHTAFRTSWAPRSSSWPACSRLQRLAATWPRPRKVRTSTSPRPATGRQSPSWSSSSRSTSR